MLRPVIMAFRVTLLVAVVFVLSAAQSPAPAEAAPAAGAKSAAKAKKAKKPPKRKGWRRGGINPCNTPDPGFGIYGRWSRAPSMGQMIAPGKGGMTRGGGFDLIVHFHGHEPIRKEFVKTAKGIVLVGIDLGIGSGAYYQAFAAPSAFKRLLKSVEKEMAKRNGRKKAYVRKLALSAWSAGYGAVEQILRQPAGKKVDAVILLDSVHTGYADAKAKKLQTHSLAPFVEFARRASRGQRFMYHSYSSIDPPGYASTRECGRYIIKRIGGKPRKARRNDVLGLEMFERYDRGGFHARGYRGDDKPDHCAHIGLMKDVVRVHLRRRWNTPKGRRAPFKPGERKKAPPGGTIHVVADGQSLGRIANRYKISVEAIRDANGLTKSGRKIQPGDELIIPAANRSAGKAGGAVGRKPRPGEKVHVVADGQSLGRIAKRYQVSVDAIREANGLSRSGRKIQPGDRLIIPAKGGAKSKPGGSKGKSGKTQGRAARPGEVVHIIARKDSLWALAKKYDTTVAAIREANGLREDGPPIRAGQRLLIPKGKKPKKKK